MASNSPFKLLLFVRIAGFHFLWLGYIWLYRGLGGQLNGLILLLLQLAALATAASFVPLFFPQRRRIAWVVLAIAWALSTATIVDTTFDDARQKWPEIIHEFAPNVFR